MEPWHGAEPRAGCPWGSGGVGGVGVGTQCWLVAATTLSTSRSPVNDDEAQAHDHEEHSKEGKAGSLWGQGSSQGQSG